ncbi:hypothetical protein [Tenacibaculum jejuense]|uniref:Gliding motility-associated protein GldM N-terminal domain-containing protein n=1 Tax=Tenacibaculum jejuense TaxID=584609 RepID=A0A238U6S3_9FLAO|nr:hypothetical protein [Tenacibaculum jejuense]SNR14802.1 protein of unknown function [Tenacibaculum jejuense]
MGQRIILVVFLFLTLILSGQHQYVTNKGHESLEKAIYVSHEIIEGRTAFFERQAEEKPLMFQKTKVLIGELNRLSNNVKSFIDTIQKEVNTERVVYDLLQENHYKKLLFTPQGKLTKRAKKLKVKLDSLYNFSLRVNVHKLSQLENFTKEHFKTDNEYYDFEEQKLSFFDHLFYDKTNYGIMMSMYYLILDVQTFQLLYYGTVMSY